MAAALLPRGRNFELKISRLQLDFKCSTGLLRIKVVSPACSCASRIPYSSRASIIAVRTDVTDDRTGDMTTVLTEFSTCFYFGVRRLPKFRNMESKKSLQPCNLHRNFQHVAAARRENPNYTVTLGTIKV